MEVVDEAAEFGLCEALQIVDCVGCDQQCRVVCICVYCRIWDCFDNVVDVEEEEGCGEGAALRDAVRYCLCF